MGLVEGCRPAGEELEGVLGSRIGLGPIHDEGQARVGRQRYRLEGQMEVADDRVVQVLGAGVVVADVVGRPARAELLAADGQFADQVREGPVVRVTAGLGAEVGDDVVGGAVPVDEEVAGAGLRNRNRATLTGRTGSTYIS